MGTQEGIISMTYLLKRLGWSIKESTLEPKNSTLDLLYEYHESIVQFTQHALKNSFFLEITQFQKCGTSICISIMSSSSINQGTHYPKPSSKHYVLSRCKVIHSCYNKRLCMYTDTLMLFSENIHQVKK